MSSPSSSFQPFLTKAATELELNLLLPLTHSVFHRINTVSVERNLSLLPEQFTLKVKAKSIFLHFQLKPFPSLASPYCAIGASFLASLSLSLFHPNKEELRQNVMLFSCALEPSHIHVSLT